jgi:hypothetical protein
MSSYPPRPLPAEYVRKAVISIRDQSKNANVEKGILGALIGVINRVVGGDANRRAIFGYLFRDGTEPLSTRDLSGPEFAALYRWSKITKTDAGKWVPSDEYFLIELQYVAVAAIDLAERAREKPDTDNVAGFGVDTSGPDETSIPDFRSYADQLELFVLRGRGEL